jgi:uncharacterized protein
MKPPPPFSLILLPTLQCDADCEYCFEKKGGRPLSPDVFPEIFAKLFAFMDERNAQELHVHWQGGEILTLSPKWVQDAGARIGHSAETHGKQVKHFLQSNLIGYNASWEPVIANMFENSIGSSVDFPNRHRKVKGASPEGFNPLWYEKAAAARHAGNHIGVISIPSTHTLEAGAEAFYDYFTQDLGITDFQLNTPFAGGPANAVKAGFPLDPERLALFFTQLVDIWMARGYAQGVRIGPFDQLLACFMDEPHTLPCIWHRNCADHFICIHPEGHLAQCDCWVASYPEYRFGNIFDSGSLSDILGASAARKRFLRRPADIIQNRDCIDCDFLAICHGGCPIRAYSLRGNLYDKDPYCPTYLAVFGHMKTVAARLAAGAKVEPIAQSVNQPSYR